jgi:hypothetical protein
VVVDTVNIDVTVPLAAGVTDAGVSAQVTVAFTGAIAQLNPTAELNPLIEVTVAVDVVEFPAAVFAETGLMLKLKSFTVNANTVVRF